MSLDWHNPTSRSKQFGIFVFFACIPIISFYLGIEYNKTVQIYTNIPENVVNFVTTESVEKENNLALIQDTTPTTTSVSVLHKGNTFINKKFGFSLELPSDMTMTSVPIQERDGDTYKDNETLYSFEEGRMVIIPKTQLTKDPFCSEDLIQLKNYTEMMSIDKVTTTTIQTQEMKSITVYGYGPLQEGGGKYPSYTICSSEIGFFMDGDVSLEKIKNIFSSLIFITN